MEEIENKVSTEEKLPESPVPEAPSEAQSVTEMSAEVQSEAETPAETLPAAKKRSWIPYLVWFLIGVGAAVWYMSSQGLWKGLEAKVRLRVISDGFFISGALILSIGAFVFVTQKGAFDAIRYAFGSLVSLFRKNANTDKYLSYMNYKKSKADNEKLNLKPMMLSGLAVLLIGLALVAVYMKRYPG